MKKIVLTLNIFLALSSGFSQVKYYGVTYNGGDYNGGVIFEWDQITNTYTKKIDFGGSNTAYLPIASLAQYGNKLYGTTTAGGVNDYGVIFEWDPATNIYTKKIDFDGVNGRDPLATLTLLNGKFYGVTRYGGTNFGGFGGAIFEWDPVTNIYTKKNNFDGVNGRVPQSKLLYLNNKFYGTTFYGGVNDFGVIFEWDPVTNIYTKKIDFDGVNGKYSIGALMLNNGKIYGLTLNGGVNNLGVIFEWDPVTNIYTKKKDFNGISDGAGPHGSLTENNGKLYGMTWQGGANNQGVIFEWDPSTNIYIKKRDLDVVSGANALGSLIITNGKFYGMTLGGGALSYGVIFEWDPITNIYNKKIDLELAIGAMPYGDLLEFNNNLLPIKLLSFTTSLQNNNNASMQWKIAIAEDGGKYELQRSTDGRSFTTVNLQTGNSFTTQFNYIDPALSYGAYYYKLKMTDKDGKITYSNIAIVKVGSKERLVSVYPNPVKRGESMQLSLQNITANKIEIINALGQVVYCNAAKQTGSIGIPISSLLAPGQYVVRIVSEDKVHTQKLLIKQ